MHCFFRLQLSLHWRYYSWLILRKLNMRHDKLLVFYTHTFWFLEEWGRDSTCQGVKQEVNARIQKMKDGEGRRMKKERTEDTTDADVIHFPGCVSMRSKNSLRRTRIWFPCERLHGRKTTHFPVVVCIESRHWIQVSVVINRRLCHL